MGQDKASVLQESRCFSDAPIDSVKPPGSVSAVAGGDVFGFLGTPTDEKDLALSIIMYIHIMCIHIYVYVYVYVYT